MKGKIKLIKHNMSRNINAARGTKTSIPLEQFTISKKHTFGGTKVKFVGLVRAEARKATTPKDL